jgi:hypothetical protein
LDLDSDTYPPRTQLLAFLDAHGIPWCDCACPSDSGVLLGGTELIYLDVPFDAENRQYQLVANCLETPEGAPRDAKVRFLCLPLAKALLAETQLQDSAPDSGQGSGDLHA